MCASRSPPRPLWRARRAHGRCLLQDVMRRVRDQAHERPGKATGPASARGKPAGDVQAQVAAHVWARLWIVLRSCACRAAVGLSTPVDKRVDVRAESVSGVCDQWRRQGGHRRQSEVGRLSRGMEDGR
jgi:hypothetical protein